jgi:ribosomal protein S25
MGTLDLSEFDLEPIPRAPKIRPDTSMSIAGQAIFDVMDYEWTLTEVLADRRGISLRRAGEILRRLHMTGKIESRWVGGRKNAKKEHRKMRGT